MLFIKILLNILLTGAPGYHGRTRMPNAWLPDNSTEFCFVFSFGSLSAAKTELRPCQAMCTTSHLPHSDPRKWTRSWSLMFQCGNGDSERVRNLLKARKKGSNRWKQNATAGQEGAEGLWEVPTRSKVSPHSYSLTCASLRWTQVRRNQPVTQNPPPSC